MMKLIDLPRADIERIRNDKQIKWIQLAEDLGVREDIIRMTNPSNRLLDQLLRYDVDMFINALESQPDTLAIRQYLAYRLSGEWAAFPIRECSEDQRVYLARLFKPLRKKERAALHDNLLAGDAYKMILAFDRAEMAEAFRMYMSGTERYLLFASKIMFVNGNREEIEANLTGDYLLLRVADIPEVDAAQLREEKVTT